MYRQFCCFLTKKAWFETKNFEFGMKNSLPRTKNSVKSVIAAQECLDMGRHCHPAKIVPVEVLGTKKVSCLKWVSRVVYPSALVSPQLLYTDPLFFGPLDLRFYCLQGRGIVMSQCLLFSQPMIARMRWVWVYEMYMDIPVVCSNKMLCFVST